MTGKILPKQLNWSSELSDFLAEQSSFSRMGFLPLFLPQAFLYSVINNTGLREKSFPLAVLQGAMFLILPAICYSPLSLLQGHRGSLTQDRSFEGHLE